ncbi:MAG: hypothetical protein CML04_07080 [Pseudozobellia sp.]|nr:hypothetical protein [Pseudozobellia sp.]MBG50110.1 hypothetical protein [Pseudozobellia sp.]
MKHTVKLSLMSLCLCTALVSAQEIAHNSNTVDVRALFNEKYPNAHDVEWERTAFGYEVEFEIGRKDYDIWYNENGVELKSKEDIGQNELPAAVLENITSNYKDFRIESAELLINDGTKSYKVEVEKGWDFEKDLFFDEKGTLLKEIDD